MSAIFCSPILKYFIRKLSAAAQADNILDLLI